MPAEASLMITRCETAPARTHPALCTLSFFRSENSAVGVFDADFAGKEHGTSSDQGEVQALASPFCAFLLLPPVASSPPELLPVFVSCSVFCVNLLSP